MAGRSRGSNLIVLASGLVLALVGCSTPEHVPQPELTVDLLQQDWAYLPGVTVGAGGLVVGATDRRIVEQDGSGGQPNPPLQLYGTRLAVHGHFSITVTIVDSTADASLTLYDRPPVVADEFRIEPAAVRLTLRGSDLGITVWDGSPQEDVTRPRPAHDEHVVLSDPAAPLTVSRSGEELRVASDGRTVASVAGGDVFTSGELWLGLSSERGSFAVRSLTARGGDGDLRVIDTRDLLVPPAPDGLQALTARVRPEFRVGAAMALGPLTSDPDYARAALSNFGSVTPENAMKPQFLSPSRGVYTFAEADALIDIARRHGLTVHGHTITFSEALPRWMQDLPTDTESERQSSAVALLDYVSAVVTHFKGRLDSLDVVNEPFDVDQGTELQDNVWYRVFGPDYPAVVSQAVYAADPDVAQFLNENGADVPGPRQDALLELALETNARGGHISGVGLQAHVYDIDRDAIGADDLTQSIDLFAEHGLQVRISENDVTDAEGTDAQADQYAAVFAACFRHPGCASYTTWGVDDRYDWYVDGNGSLRQGHDLLFDGGEPTPAYEEIQRLLQQ
ncbi:endo-1,4-beta-xylanase [Geodermatophilus sp. SYSU D00779]